MAKGILQNIILIKKIKKLISYDAILMLTFSTLNQDDVTENHIDE